MYPILAASLLTRVIDCDGRLSMFRLIAAGDECELSRRILGLGRNS